jgi:uncharacterized protein YlxW (UPF0749 family)
MESYLRPDLRFREDARELASLIVNRWETNKDFDELVLAVEEYIFDLDNSFNTRVNTLAEEIEKLKKTIDSLEVK